MFLLLVCQVTRYNYFYIVADHNTCVRIDSFQAFSMMKFHVLTLLSYVFLCVGGYQQFGRHVLTLQMEALHGVP